MVMRWVTNPEQSSGAIIGIQIRHFTKTKAAVATYKPESNVTVAVLVTGLVENHVIQAAAVPTKTIKARLTNKGVSAIKRPVMMEYAAFHCFLTRNVSFSRGFTPISERSFPVAVEPM